MSSRVTKLLWCYEVSTATNLCVIFCSLRLISSHCGVFSECFGDKRSGVRQQKEACVAPDVNELTGFKGVKKIVRSRTNLKNLSINLELTS